ncbi:UNVERIFIED_CONTAM: hypothetical protein FKN15_029224 [Acipenser sinensis]
MGHLIKRHPETRIPYLLGLWSNLFSINLTQGWTSLSGSFPNWIQWLREAVRSKDEGAVAGRPAALDTFFVTPVSAVTQLLEEMLSDRPIIGQSYNFMRGLNLHRDYSQSHGFTAWKGTHLDAFPNQLTPADPQLHLADSGFSINTGTPPLLRPERGVDVLLSFNFTWGDQFKALKLTEQYCADHCLPFPRIDLSSIEGRPLQECYVFTDEGDPRAPIVLHFPLVNHSFRENSAPGVQRVGEAELSEARFEVLTPDSDYRTFDVSYTPAQHQRLVELTCYNVLNNSQALQGALRQALDRKREARHAQEVTQRHAAA